jgi:carboxyl-terminal processing protease
VREKARDEARTKLEDELAKNNNKPLKPLPEFGSSEDFQLAQALNRLKGQPVVVSKTAVERKPEDTSTQ